MEPLENLCSFLELRIDHFPLESRNTALDGYFLLQKITVHIAGELKRVAFRVPAEGLDEGEGLVNRVISYNLIDTRDPSHQSHGAGRFYGSLNDHHLEVVHVGLGYVDGLSAKTLDQPPNGASVEGGHHSVSCLHRLKGDGPFLASDLSNDDPIWALPQGRFEEIEHADLAASLLFSRLSGHLSNPVLVGNL